jgi:GrpB-like predicted nucleotidyltransferase (UPF0157 family)
VPDDLTDEANGTEWIGGRPRHDAPISLVPYDPAWPALFDGEATGIRSALGPDVIRLEHTGSTSVPGLAAKPTIDIALVVPDSADEGAYVPSLEAAGYRLAIREPGWFEHRLLRGSNPSVNLHTFSRGCPEVERMVRFRDWLRTHDADRELYERTKRDLAARRWGYVQDYADAKGEVVEAILARAAAAAALD